MSSCWRISCRCCSLRRLFCEGQVLLAVASGWSPPSRPQASLSHWTKWIWMGTKCKDIYHHPCNSYTSGISLLSCFLEMLELVCRHDMKGDVTISAGLKVKRFSSTQLLSVAGSKSWWATKIGKRLLLHSKFERLLLWNPMAKSLKEYLILKSFWSWVTRMYSVPVTSKQVEGSCPRKGWAPCRISTCR